MDQHTSIGKYKKTNPKEIFPSTDQAEPRANRWKLGHSDYPSALLTLQRKPIKDEPLSNMILFSFVTVVLLEKLVPKI
jgi:hypothetical protein